MKVLKSLFRILAIIFILAFATAAIVACSGDANKYHAELYNIGYADLNDEFL